LKELIISNVFECHFDVEFVPFVVLDQPLCGDVAVVGLETVYQVGNEGLHEKRKSDLGTFDADDLLSGNFDGTVR
jgi:hypothetical protein